MNASVRPNPNPAAFAHLPWGTPVAEVMEVFDRDGGLILDGALTTQQVAAVNADIDPELGRLHKGSLSEDPARRDFHGALTKRLTNVVTLSKTFREAFLQSELTRAYVGATFAGVCDSFWLSTTQVIEIYPGEKAQVLHRDMGNYPIFYRYGPDFPELMVNMIVAMMDIDELAGATRILPGSHKWDFDLPLNPEETTAAELKAGSVLFYSGKLAHGGGANRTEDVKRRVITCPFNPGFMMPEEAYPFVVPMEVVRQMSPELQQMTGFRSFHQRNPPGGSLWQHNYDELADFLKL